MTWIRNLLSSSLGKKALMAVTGLLLVGFLVVHLAGNLLLYSGSDGAAFDGYARKLEENPVLPIAEIALVALFVVHIATALKVSLENREARSTRYAARAPLENRTLASTSMVLTGLVILVFLIVHLSDFRIGKMFAESGTSLFAMVRRRLTTPVGAAIYLAGSAAVAVHLKHAFRSAFQTLGLSHPHLNPLLVRAGWVIAIVLGLGFLSFPVYFFLSAGAR